MNIKTRRILAAQAAVKMHQVVREQESSPVLAEDLIDLLTDLRHWAREKGVNIGNCFTASLDHFKAERDE